MAIRKRPLQVSATTQSYRFVVTTATATTADEICQVWGRPHFNNSTAAGWQNPWAATNGSGSVAVSGSLVGGCTQTFSNGSSWNADIYRLVGGSSTAAGNSGGSLGPPMQWIDSYFCEHRWHSMIAGWDGSSKAWQYFWIADRARRPSWAYRYGGPASGSGTVIANKRVDATGTGNANAGEISLLGSLFSDTGSAGTVPHTSNLLAAHLLRNPNNRRSLPRVARYFTLPEHRGNGAPWMVDVNESVQAINGGQQFMTGEKVPAFSRPRYLFNRSRFGLVAILVTSSDTGTGTEATSALTADVSTPETGTGTDALSILAADVSTTEDAAAVEAALLDALLDGTETGTSTDTSSLEAALTALEDAAGAEDALLAADTTDTETGTAADEVAVFFIDDGDTATAIDAGEVIQPVAIEIIVRNRVKTIATPSKTRTTVYRSGETRTTVVRSGKTSTLEIQ